MLDKILSQERSPVCTGISLLTTVVIEALALFLFGAARHAELAGVGFGPLVLLLIAFGCKINVTMGLVGYMRQELWCGRIAVMCIVVWLSTLVGIANLRALCWLMLVLCGHSL
jgi:hypothetical protein